MAEGPRRESCGAQPTRMAPRPDTPRPDTPRADDAPAAARTLLAAWLETYPNARAGIDVPWIMEHRGPSAGAEGIAQLRGFFEDVAAHPDRSFARVVRSGCG